MMVGAETSQKPDVELNQVATAFEKQVALAETDRLIDTNGDK